MKPTANFLMETKTAQESAFDAEYKKAKALAQRVRELTLGQNFTEPELGKLMNLPKQGIAEVMQVLGKFQYLKYQTNSIQVPEYRLITDPLERFSMGIEIIYSLLASHMRQSSMVLSVQDAIRLELQAPSQPVDKEVVN